MSSRHNTKSALRAVTKHASTHPKRPALRKLRIPKARLAAPVAARSAPAVAVSRSAPPVALDQKSIARELATCIAAKKAYDASPEGHLAVMGLFNGLGFSESALVDVAGAAKSAGVSIARLTDADFEKLPDSVPRPRGPSEFFNLTSKDGKKGYVVITSGKPYLIFADV